VKVGSASGGRRRPVEAAGGRPQLHSLPQTLPGTVQGVRAAAAEAFPARSNRQCHTLFAPPGAAAVCAVAPCCCRGRPSCAVRRRPAPRSPRLTLPTPESNNEEFTPDKEAQKKQVSTVSPQERPPAAQTTKSVPTLLNARDARTTLLRPTAMSTHTSRKTTPAAALRRRPAAPAARRPAPAAPAAPARPLPLPGVGGHCDAAGVGGGGLDHLPAVLPVVHAGALRALVDRHLRRRAGGAVSGRGSSGRCAAPRGGCALRALGAGTEGAGRCRRGRRGRRGRRAPCRPPPSRWCCTARW
jgi:hypothetical protein